MSLHSTILSLLRVTASLATAALLLHVEVSEAQNSHYLQALYGQGFTVSDSTLDPEVDFVQVLYSNGIPGSPAGGREIYASVNSASGLLEARGATSKKLDPNRTRGFTRLDQRMYPDPGGASPIVVRVTLSLESAGDGRARNTALLQVGPCRAFITDDIGGTTPGVTPGSIDCNDTSGVDWTTTESAEGLAIVAAYAASPSTLLMQAQVSGYLGNGTTDISTGSFSISGTLHIEQLGGNAPTFQSDTFLTVPEPHSTGLALATIAALGAIARRRHATASQRRMRA
jgi:hypothetical protein